jgi:hypothetical protein
VNLIGTKVARDVSMIGASFSGALIAGFLQVGGNLVKLAPDKSSFKEVNLSGSNITGRLVMTGASFDGMLNANFMQVGGDLYMGSAAENETSLQSPCCSLISEPMLISAAPLSISRVPRLSGSLG